MANTRVATAVAVPATTNTSLVAPPEGYGSSVEAYLESAERTRVIAAITVYAASALFAVIVIAWVVGLLPGAARIF